MTNVNITVPGPVAPRILPSVAQAIQIVGNQRRMEQLRVAQQAKAQQTLFDEERELLTKEMQKFIDAAPNQPLPSTSELFATALNENIATLADKNPIEQKQALADFTIQANHSEQLDKVRTREYQNAKANPLIDEGKVASAFTNLVHDNNNATTLEGILDTTEQDYVDAAQDWTNLRQGATVRDYTDGIEDLAIVTTSDPELLESSQARVTIRKSQGDFIKLDNRDRPVLRDGKIQVEVTEQQLNAALKHDFGKIINGIKGEEDQIEAQGGNVARSRLQIMESLLSEEGFLEPRLVEVSESIRNVPAQETGAIFIGGSRIAQANAISRVRNLVESGNLERTLETRVSGPRFSSVNTIAPGEDTETPTEEQKAAALRGDRVLVAKFKTKIDFDDLVKQQAFKAFAEEEGIDIAAANNEIRITYNPDTFEGLEKVSELINISDATNVGTDAFIEALGVITGGQELRSGGSPFTQTEQAIRNLNLK